MTVIPLHAARAARPLGELSDGELMVLVRGGAAAAGDAMAVLVERYHARLYSFCARLGGGDAAEEIAQDTFVALWRHRASYRDDGKLVVWLYTVARNRCRNRVRGRRRRAQWIEPATLATDEMPAEDTSHLEALIARERRRETERAIAALSLKLREAVVLRFEHELPYDQIAAILGTREPTARSRVHLALLKLRAAMTSGGKR